MHAFLPVTGTAAADESESEPDELVTGGGGGGGGIAAPLLRSGMEALRTGGGESESDEQLSSEEGVAGRFTAGLALDGTGATTADTTGWATGLAVFLTTGLVATGLGVGCKTKVMQILVSERR